MLIDALINAHTNLKAKKKKWRSNYKKFQTRPSIKDESKKKLKVLEFRNRFLFKPFQVDWAKNKQLPEA